LTGTGQGSTGHSHEVENLAGELARSITRAVQGGRYPNHESALQAFTLAVSQLSSDRDEDHPITKNKKVSQLLPVVSSFVDTKTLTTTLILFSLVTLKVLAVVNFNPTEALALIGAAGPIAVVIGSIVASIYTLLPSAIFLILAAVFAYGARRGVRFKDLDRDILRGIGALVLGLFALSVFVIPAAAFLTIFFTATAVFLLSNYFLSPSRSSVDLILSYVLLAIGVIGIITYLIGSSMWLPAEKITLQDQSSVTVIAYVLDDDGNWSSLLRESDRTIVRITTESIEHRAICRVSSYYQNKSPFQQGRTLYQVINDAARGNQASGRLPRC
jgi:hypothetical protein